VVRESLAAFSSPLPPIRTPGSGSQINRLVRGRLVGRETLFAQLVERWQLAALGQGQLLLVRGEPGVGKTRLVRELTTYAELSGGQVLAVECYADAGLPYASFAQLIGQVLAAGEDLPILESTLADLLMLTPDQRPSYTHIPPPKYADQETKQAALIESVMTLFAALTTQSPLLLFFDDLHWAGSGTLSLLRHLAQRLSRRPLMIIGAFREAELSEDRPLKGWLAGLYGESWLNQLQLPRLDKVQTQELLTTLFSSEVSWDLTEAIYGQSEGNPFFIEEICRALVESGKFYFEAGSWHRPSLDELAIPQGLKSAIDSRLRRLSKVEQETLEIAAMLGREFTYDRLRAVSRLQEGQLIAALEKAEAAQLIEEVQSSSGLTSEESRSDLRFSFSQALIRSTIVSGLGTLRRRRLGQKVAVALEEAYPDRLDELAPLLGRYFAESGQSQKAAGYLLRAGDAARRLFAHEEAIKFYKLALPLLEELEDHARAAHTYMKLGLTYHNNFQFDRARQAYEDGFALWQRMPTTAAEALAMAPHALRTHLRHLPTLDPTRANHVSSSILIQQLFSGLVRLNAEHEIVPDVALSWEVLEDGQKYIFYLRDDVRWSDGRPVTAGDFEYAWKRTLAPESGPYPAELLLDIRYARAYHEGELADPGLVGVRAADDWILIIELEGPSSYFLHLLAQPVAMPVPGHIVQTAGDEWTQPGNLVVNGPFLVKEWRPDQYIHLERNPVYHGRRNGNLEAVEVALLDDAEEAWQLYQEDELDCLYLTPLFSPGRLEHARQHSPDQYMGGPTPSIIFLALDVTRPPFDNLLVRQALAIATDKEMLANVTLTGLYPPANGGFVPPGLPGHVPGIGLSYDPERARELLSQAGYPGGRDFPVINARVLDANIYQIISRALHSQWLENLGLNIEFQTMPSAGKAHIYLTAVAPDYPDPDTFLRANNWSPETGWHHPTFEQLVDQGRRVADREKRLAMYHQAETILVEEAALLPLVYGRFHLLLKPRLVKYPTSPLLIPYWKDTVIETSLGPS
jgi:oligopeptide transport system substrate-binding protein